MGSVVRFRPKEQRRTVGIAVGATLLLVVLIVGLAFANSVGASRVADNARSLHWTNASLGTASVTRAALVQAATFTELAESGLATQEDVDFAMEQVSNAHEQLLELRESGEATMSLPELIHFIAPVEDALAGLERGTTDEVNHLIMSDLEATYLDLVDSLQAEQASIQDQIDANTAGAARTTDFVRFFLTFAIPASAVLIYRYIARRAVREHQMKTDLELAAERAVSHAKDEFIAGLSHELRTPLTSIYGFAEVLTDGGADDPDTTRESAQIIANEAAEMTRMVDDLLAAARLDSTGVEIQLDPTKVATVVHSAVTPFTRAGLRVNVEVEECTVLADAARLRHVLVNLLSNAARHGGPEIGVAVSAGDSSVDIEVWDNGPGVPEDQVDRLFERFIHEGETPLLTGSLGLGLAIASRLTHMMGGKISYQRFVQKTYFIVTLPQAVPGADEEPQRESIAEMIRTMTA